MRKDNMPKNNKVNPTRRTNDNIELLQRLKGLIMELKAIYEKTMGTNIQKEVMEISKTTQKILQCLIDGNDDNNEVSKHRLFIEYYLPELVGILKQYATIKELNIAGESATKSVARIESFIPKARSAFSRILEDVAIRDSVSTEADIQIMIGELERNGFL